MSFSKSLRTGVFVALSLSVGALLGACSFSPVYGGSTATSPSFDFTYAKPNSRLEQIIYQELDLRFGSSSNPLARQVKVSASGGPSDMMMSRSQNGNISRQVTITATLTITNPNDPKQKPISLTRQATAELTRNDQVLADREADIEAAERAAKAVAESLRLAVLATTGR